MAEFKVLKRFRLLDDVDVQDVGPVQEIGGIIDITVKRADQVVKRLGSSFLERIDNKIDEKIVEEQPIEEKEVLEEVVAAEEQK